MKVLLGGIPLGCDNIGDEAILACVIGVFREIMPAIQLGVCTNDIKGVEQKFQVRGEKLFGFLPELKLSDFAQVVKNYDCFVWAGATGLSDYPKMGCDIIGTANNVGVKTIVWNVGMNDKFNPAFFKLHGKKLKLAQFLSKITFLDIQKYWEKHWANQIRRTIAQTLSRCDLIVLRDQPSLRELRKCASFPQAIFGADTALLQKESPDDMLLWRNPLDRDKFYETGKKKIALCLSAQNKIKELDKFAKFLDDFIERHDDVIFVMIPMNPCTDYALMQELQRQLKYPQNTILTCFKEPEDVQNIVGKCNLTISSRLHLMILSLNRLVPSIGIARGSKIQFFLDEYNLPTCGSTDQIDFDQLTKMSEFYLNDTAFAAQAALRRNEMLNNLQQAEVKLSHVLHKMAE